MIDLHSHVLWGIDDGPAELEESVRLVRDAADGGVHTLAATPHLRSDFPGVEVRDIPLRTAELNERLVAAGVGATVVPAAEVDFAWAQTASAEELRLTSYGQRGRDILLETPYSSLTPAFDETLFRLCLGFRVLLAHPERNPTFQADPSRLAELVRRGALVQVTARSLTRRRRSPVRRLALLLVEEGLAHVIASDAHGPGLGRPPGLTAAVDAAAQVAPLRAHWMVTDAPAAILQGDPVGDPPTGRPRGRLLGRLIPRGAARPVEPS